MTENLVIQIVLPKTLALKDGSVMGQEVTFYVASALTPYYASVDMVRLAGGTYLRNLSDFTLASQIYKYSREADVMSFNRPHEPNPGADETDVAFRKHALWLFARQNYVANRAAFESIISVFDTAVSRGSKTLANFSVHRVSLPKDESVPRRLQELEEQYKGWLPVIKSGGEIAFGGHAKPVMAAKGLYDRSEGPAGRLWMVTGLGANRKSLPGYGSAGKPFKYMSPPIIQWHMGRNFGAYVTALPTMFSSSIS